MSKKKYLNAAAKQRAYRIRHGQKRKVPIPIRRGEQLGTSEAVLRAKKDNETWEEYQKYITDRVCRARSFDKKSVEKYKIDESGESVGAKRGFGRVVEPEMDEDYFETQHQHEESFKKLGEGKKIRGKRKQK
jgi:hypothetical protein